MKGYNPKGPNFCLDFSDAISIAMYHSMFLCFSKLIGEYVRRFVVELD